MTGRWGFLIGLAGFGFFLYSAFHPSRPDLPGGASGVPPADTWQPLSSSPAPSWSKAVGLPSIPGGQMPLAHTPDGTPDRHDLNTQSTVYLGAPDSPHSPENPLLGLVRTFLSGETKDLPELSAVRRVADPLSGPAGPLIPAGSILSGKILRSTGGPGEMPIFVLLPRQTVGSLRLSRPVKLLGYPDGAGNGSRLRIRFVRAIFENGLEAPMSGYAVWGDREGIPVRSDRHMAGNVGRSLGRDSLMLGGETLGAAGWMGNPGLGSMLAMQEASNALYEAQNALPPGSRQPSWHIERNTPLRVVVISGFPVPQEEKAP
ncbi:hypothetical protein ACSYAY_11100 [Leptospirillum ferriphilum]|uniref:Uncharacterized protein n=2 Tax=Leptospirillum TaxID=179 RepID=A0A094YHT3_9BACT|nr:hypothetical protein [Leptospirillum ferriphilum]EDZ39324.1 MAG: Hypothetical protein CGL2_11233022 [Leptospirillum sp. Group II '5-way CG']KGA92761.1 hypothetical protein LptCag_0496 [Leptospirillum ferriphilum]